MNTLLKLTEDWISRSEDFTSNSLADLEGKLPVVLKKPLRSVQTAHVSFEWKHFWALNARLWLTQHERTLRLPRNAEWSDQHDALFESWNRSEHAKEFLAALNRGVGIQAASRGALTALRDQLVDLARCYFGHRPVTVKRHRPIFELGEFGKKTQSEHFVLRRRESLEFLNWDLPKHARHVKRLTAALTTLKSVTPENFELLARFTRRVVPIRQKEFVSYSLQSLPGHSFINMYDRDDLDLLDDLLHENGHHILNHFLIVNSPLREDAPDLFYSPWRRTLRPVRGIYHAHCTFYFALALYSDLVAAVTGGVAVFDKKLTRAQESKICRRYLEEWHMLEVSAEEIAKAAKRNLITSEGMALFSYYEDLRRTKGNSVRRALGLLSKKDRAQLEKLRAELARRP